MIGVSQDTIVRCYNDLKADPEIKISAGKAEVYFAETSGLELYYPLFYKLVSESEKSRAKKFFSEKERETYIICHGFLRLLLAGKIKADPSEVSFKRGEYNKPGLAGDPLFFNISHTKKAFAIGISEEFPLGVDIENMDRRVDLTSISKAYFSRRELEYTMKSGADQKERFFLIWTRKEALLKAIGTGITDDLNKIEVSGSENFLEAGLFNKSYCQSQVRNHFIYSKKITGHLLSLAMPAAQLIDFNHLDSDNIKSWLGQY
jgi:4'-phosphopantetheinyl transferase